MRKATDAEQEAAARLASSSWFQFARFIFAITGFAVALMYVVTLGGQWTGPLSYYVVAMVAFGAGYVGRGVRYARH